MLTTARLYSVAQSGAILYAVHSTIAITATAEIIVYDATP